MKKPVLIFLAFILLCAAWPVDASGKIFRFMSTFANPPSGWLFLCNHKIHIAWQIAPGTGQEKMNVVILKNSALYTIIASGMSNKFANMGAPNVNYWYNEIWWTPILSDAGCHYRVRVSSQDNSMMITSDEFNIYPSLNYEKNGVVSYARLYEPKGGLTYLINKYIDIKWEANAMPSAWPSGKIHLKLLANDNGNIIPVGDIADVPIDYSGCPMAGKYTWLVGSLTNISHPERKPDGKNGVKYRVRLTGDNSTYDSDDFFIGQLVLPKVPKKINP